MTTTEMLLDELYGALGTGLTSSLMPTLTLTQLLDELPIRCAKVRVSYTYPLPYP